ncbi:MAG: hypothetical protein R3B82_07645 [Sandaracinaceae bacterium]
MPRAHLRAAEREEDLRAGDRRLLVRPAPLVLVEDRQRAAREGPALADLVVEHAGLHHLVELAERLVVDIALVRREADDLGVPGGAEARLLVRDRDAREAEGEPRVVGEPADAERAERLGDLGSGPGEGDGDLAERLRAARVAGAGRLEDLPEAREVLLVAAPRLHLRDVRDRPLEVPVAEVHRGHVERRARDEVRRELQLRVGEAARRAAARELVHLPEQDAQRVSLLDVEARERLRHLRRGSDLIVLFPDLDQVRVALDGVLDPGARLAAPCRDGLALAELRVGALLEPGEEEPGRHDATLVAAGSAVLHDPAGDGADAGGHAPGLHVGRGQERGQPREVRDHRVVVAARHDLGRALGDVVGQRVAPGEARRVLGVHPRVGAEGVLVALRVDGGRPIAVRVLHGPGGTTAGHEEEDEDRRARAPRSHAP